MIIFVFSSVVEKLYLKFLKISKERRQARIMARHWVISGESDSEFSSVRRKTTMLPETRTRIKLSRFGKLPPECTAHGATAHLL